MSRNDHPAKNPFQVLPALLIVALLAAAPAGAQLPDPPPPGGHGMLVLGTQGKIYLVHLAMRSRAEHKFQLVLEVDFEAAGAIGDRTFVGDSDLASVPANEIYFRDRNHPDNPVSIYTLDPLERFALTEIPRGERLSFRGDIVRGHFERDDEPPILLENAVIVVRKILFFQDFRTLDPDAIHPLTRRRGRLEMLLFGSEGEYFLTHRITLHGEPSDNAFHQVFPVSTASAERFRFGSLEQAVAVTIDGSEATDLGRLPVAGGTFPARIEGLIEGDPTSRQLEIEVEGEHYLEILG